MCLIWLDGTLLTGYRYPISLGVAPPICNTSCDVGWQPSRVVAGDVCLEMCLHSSLSLLQTTGLKHVLSTSPLSHCKGYRVNEGVQPMTWPPLNFIIAVCCLGQVKDPLIPTYPNVPEYDIIPIVLVLLFGLSNGYLGSTAMVTAPQ